MKNLLVILILILFSFQSANANDFVYLEYEKDIRVKLSIPKLDKLEIVSEEMKIIVNNKEYISDNLIIFSDSTLSLPYFQSKLPIQNHIKILSKNNIPLEIKNWDRTKTFGTKTYNDNLFLGNIIVYPKDWTVVNEIDMDNYILGIAEVPESDEEEKRKALVILARSYAYHYLYTGYKKFSDDRYDASDDPAVFQKYLGYAFTMRAPRWQKAVNETKNEILSSNYSILRTAYSSCTGISKKRKIPKEAGFTDPYYNTVSNVYQDIEDDYGFDFERSLLNKCGHGVGLSGYGATNLAKNGFNYKQILDFYYQNTDIKNIFFLNH